MTTVTASLPLTETPATAAPLVRRGNSATAIPTGGGSMSIGTKPTFIDVPPMHFLIMDAPRQSNLHVYIRDMAKHGVTKVVRVCEPTYHGGELESAGMSLYDMEYKDGTSPPKELIQTWLELVEKTFYGPIVHSSSSNATVATTMTAASRPVLTNNGAVGSAPPPAAEQQQSGTTPATPTNGTKMSSSSSGAAIAVHCVAGLGRAPVFVAIALIEFAGMDPVEAVSLIRAKRRGAINEKQLLYLEGYKKQYKRSGGGGKTGDTGCGCVIS